MNRQTILIVIVILMLAGAAFIWSRYSQTTPVVEETEDFDIDISELRRLKTINLDTSVLQEPFFRSLETPVETVTQPTVPTSPDTKTGRTNPFTPF